MKPFRLLAVAVLAIAVVGCAARVKTVTNLPAGVTQSQAQNWDSAVANLHKIAGVTSSLRQAVIDANKVGVFPDGPEYATALQTIAKIDQLQLSASTLLRQAPNNFTDSTKAQVGELINQILAQIQTLNAQGVTGIKNPTSLQTINNLINQIIAISALVLQI